jgi:hypothetical protein
VPGPAARLIEAALAAADAAPAAPRARAVALGWATVEFERTIAALAADLDVSPAFFVPAEDSAALGAWSRVARGVLPGGRSLAVLEPATEGPLAAILARFDEGLRFVWIETATAADDDDDPAAGPPRTGPFGRERLIAGRPVDGLHRLLLQPVPGTIRP